MKTDWKKLVISLLACQIAGAIGSIFTMASLGNWYSALIKPSFNLPSWVFGPVWTVLFLLMGYALYIVWNSKSKTKEDRKAKKIALEMFASQLLLNIAWSAFFFGLHSPLAAFVNIIFLWAFIILTIMKFDKVSNSAAFILIPYLLWVTFAAILNFAIVLLNY